MEKREVSQSDEAWRRRTAKLLSKIENSGNHNWFVSTLQLRVDSSMHIFMQLLRFSSDFTFTRKCKTAIEIGTPLEWHMWQFSFDEQKRTIASVPKICVYSNETQHTLTIALDVNNRGLEFIDKNGSLAHPSHKHFLQQLYSKDSDEFQIRKNVLRAVRLEAIYFLRPDICNFRWKSNGGGFFHKQTR